MPKTHFREAGHLKKTVHQIYYIQYIENEIHLSVAVAHHLSFFNSTDPICTEQDNESFNNSHSSCLIKLSGKHHLGFGINFKV